MNTTFKALIGTALLSASSLALAIPYLGGISFSSLPGTSFTYDTTGNTFDFDNDIPNAGVNNFTGDFAKYFAAGDQATFYDFEYSPFVGPQKIWEATASVGDNANTVLELILNSATVVFESNTLVSISGAGYITDGVAINNGEWNISANEAMGAFSWSSSTEVPEPGTLALLGLGLAGLGAARRRQKA